MEKIEIVGLSVDSNLRDLFFFLDLAVEYGQDLKKIHFKDQSWLGLKTRSRKFNYDKLDSDSLYENCFNDF